MFSLLQDYNERQEIIDSLILHWFSSDQRKLEELLEIHKSLNGLEDFNVNQDINKIDNNLTEPKFYLRKALVRNSFFRKFVVHVYDYQCAFCRMRVTRLSNQNLVDGAHIKPLSIFYDNTINNGISLCKNHHWAFDKGWFCINSKYRIIVSKDLQEESPNSKLMKDYQGEVILLPSSEKFLPSIESLNGIRKMFSSYRQK
ncbi:MAG: HNH endonuclease [Desertifilum sp.]|nr:HNH endonuclease [Desertifilum sp.]